MIHCVMGLVKDKVNVKVKVKVNVKVKVPRSTDGQYIIRIRSMKSSERLKLKRAVKLKNKDETLKKSPAGEILGSTDDKKRSSTKSLRKSLLSICVTASDLGKDVVIHDKYSLTKSDTLFDTIDHLIILLQQKEDRKDPKILSVVEYSNFPTFEFQLRNTNPSDQKCCICQYEFEKVKDYQQQLQTDDDNDILHLKCTHLMHKNCFVQLLGNKKWIKCPLCYTISGEMTGDQPQGTMTHSVEKNLTCDGYPKGTIVISYSLQSGNREGQHFSGTHRTAYLPNTPEGQEIHNLLKTAFNRKLTFTVGTSVTTGLENQVVWNGIHHKTHTSGGSSHFGYPDPTYFNRVKLELAMKGVC